MPQLTTLVSGFLLLCVLTSVCLACGTTTFVSEGGRCDNGTLLCKNYLECSPLGYCFEPVQGANCTNNETVCGTGVLYCNGSVCLERYRDNGDPCTNESQCLSGNCSGGICNGSLDVNATCNLANYNYGCRAGLFCQASNNGSDTCQLPLLKGASCINSLLKWQQYVASVSVPFRAQLPQGICAPGTACMFTGLENTTAVCTALYSGAVNDSCRMPASPMPAPYFPPDLLSIEPHCGLNLTCQNVGSTSTHCMAGPTSWKPSTLNCSVPQPCPAGMSCHCGPSSSNGQPACNTVVFETECQPFLQDLVSCLLKKGCAYRPSVMPQPLDPVMNANGLGIFANLIYPSWCVARLCSLEQRRLLCCQNNQTVLAAAQLAFTPLRLPTGNSYCDLTSGWPSWVLPVIVLSGIVLVVSVIVVLYVFFRRKPDADYESINK